MLVLVVGPSGAGKDTLLDAARDRLPADARMHFARRQITRPLVAGGEKHLPIDRPTFERRRDAGCYALWWEAHGLGYAISADIAPVLERGDIVVASVSRAVLADAACRFRVRVIEVTAPAAVLAQRLAARRREDAAAIAGRLGRTIAFPPGLEVVTIDNVGTVAAGAARLLAALSPAAAAAQPA